MAQERATRTAGDPLREAHRQWVAHGWAAAADGMAMVTALARSHQLTMERIDAVLRPLDLTFARYEILQVLSFTSRGAMPMSRLGALLQVHATSVTSAVDRLERQERIRRVRRSVDRRVVLAELTDLGREAARHATTALNSQVFEDPGLDRADLAELVRLLNKLRASAGDRPDHE
jgi:DNA-binding MarR family transcriptional regulator